MASKYIVTKVDPAGGGTVTRTENVVDRIKPIQYDDYYNEFRYHWNCDTLYANPAPGYEFDHWEISVNERWYDAITDPTGQSQFSWEDTYDKVITNEQSKGNPLQITIQPDSIDPNFGSDSPGYVDLDAYIGHPTIAPEYYRPWIEHIWTVTAFFKKTSPEPTYTHLPVYEISSGKLMYHMAANKLLRDSP